MKTPEQIADLLHAIAAHPEHTIEGALCVMADIIRQRDATHRALGHSEAVAEIVAYLRAQNPVDAVEWALANALALAIERGEHRNAIADCDNKGEG